MSGSTAKRRSAACATRVDPILASRKGWFAPHAAVTPGEGGSVSVGWDPKEMWDTPITVWEPLRRMQTTSEMPGKDGRLVRLAVDYYVEAHGGRVRVRLVHSGFDDSGSWDDYIDGLDAGWGFFLFNLKHALERHRGVDRQQLSARFRTTARAGEDHPVFGATGLPIIVAVTALGVDAGDLDPGVAAALVGAGLISVLAYPLVALSLRTSRCRRPRQESNLRPRD